MRAYLDLLQHVMDEGVDRSDRTGTGTRAVFGHQMRFDLSQGFLPRPPRNCICALLFTNCCGFPSKAIQILPIYVNMASPFGMNGQIKMAILVLSMVPACAAGRGQMETKLISCLI